MTPEQTAREHIDTQLARCGWTVQTKDKINLSASRGVAVCELSFATGEPDYTLFVDGKALGTTEAKPEGSTLTELSPFNQRGGLGKAHQLFGEQLPKLLDELNTVLAA